MRRILIEVAYDGTNYAGWQIQKNGITIEQVLNETLTSFLKEEVRVIGASRTDAGVHALSAMAVFDTASTMPDDKFAYALNRYLPEDIVIQASCEVPADFHPRYAKSEKTYEYRILNRQMRIPTMRYDTFFYYRPLDADAMRAAASFLVGEHDFASFASPHFSSKTSIRTLYECSVERDRDLITIRVRGNGFLYNMVRIIAGTLIQVGEGKIAPEEMYGILMARDRDAAGPTAPARGLTLVDTTYPQLPQILEEMAREKLKAGGTDGKSEDFFEKDVAFLPD